MLCTVVPILAQDSDFTIIEEQPPGEMAVSYPSRISLSGIVVDQFGEPVINAQLTVNGQGRDVVTNEAGVFLWPHDVRSEALVEISHADTETIIRTASSFYVEDDGGMIDQDSVVNVTTTRYLEVFDITPAGGVFAGKSMTIEVPAGAVEVPVTIRSAVLPTDRAYDGSTGLQPVPLTGVVFDPPGLQFTKPIRVKIPLTRPGEAYGSQPLRLYDELLGRYVDDPKATVEIGTNSAILTISHFSRYSVGSPSQGMSRHMVRRTSDINGDGRITAQDAVFVVILSGGTHTADWQQEVEAGSTVMSTTQRGSGSSSSDSTTVSGGASYGPVSVEVSSTVSSETASEVLRTSGLSAGTTRTTDRQRTLNVGEYDTKCRYVLFIYEYWRIRTWRLHTPSSREMRGIRDAYNTFQNHDDNGYGYYRISGSTSVTAGRSLYGGMHIAVRREGGKLKVYVRSGEYLVRVPKGLRTFDCDSDNNMGSNLQGMLARDGADNLQFFGTGDGLDEANVSERTADATTSRYGGWGVLEETTPEFHRGLECGEEESSSVSVSSVLETMSEEVRSRMRSESNELSGSVSASVPLPGGFGASGGVSGSTSRSSTTSAAETYGQQMTSRVTTSIGWTIHDAHPPHVSDHVIFKLHLIYTTRKWQLVGPEKVPEGLMNSPSMQNASGRTFGQAGNQLYMRSADGSWYRSGLPVAKQKEIGFLLLRIKEVPCGEPVETPSSSVPRDTRPPVITPGPGEYHPPEERNQKPAETEQDRDIAAPPQSSRSEITSPTWLQKDQATAPHRSTVTVDVLALDDITVVNRNYVGSVQTVRVLAVDGKEQTPEQAGVEVTDEGDRIVTTVADGSRIARIALIGTAGIIDLARTAWPAPRPTPVTDVPTVSDGVIEIAGGAVDETILLPSGIIDMGTAPQDHQVNISGAPVDPVVIRPNEIAVVGHNVPPSANPAVTITNPDGQTLSGQLDGWGWIVGVDQEITRINQPVNVLVQVNGLDPGETADITFIPGPGQSIQPSQVQITSGQAEQPIPMAVFSASIMGENLFNVEVVRQASESE